MPRWRGAGARASRLGTSAGVRVAARRFSARARVATATERERLWPAMVQLFPLYEEYAQKTDRVIPVVLLTPQD